MSQILTLYQVPVIKTYTVDKAAIFHHQMESSYNCWVSCSLPLLHLQPAENFSKPLTSPSIVHFY